MNEDVLIEKSLFRADSHMEYQWDYLEQKAV